ncbi:MAG: DoxX family membrane protein, partial [Chitinophagales bacterium]
AALYISALIIVLSLLRHLPRFDKDWVNAYKTMALIGGSFVISASFLYESHGANSQIKTSERRIKILLRIGYIFLAIFFLASGYAHFKFADFVKDFIPAYIPFHTFWAYFCGICLFAGGFGLLLPETRDWAALLGGIMVLGWFLLLHIPRILAHPEDPSDRMGVCESFAFSGVLFVLAGMIRKMKA